MKNIQCNVQNGYCILYIYLNLVIGCCDQIGYCIFSYIWLLVVMIRLDIVYLVILVIGCSDQIVYCIFGYPARARSALVQPAREAR